MPKVHYLAYDFVKPPTLSEQEFYHYKQLLAARRDFEFASGRSAQTEFASERSTLKNALIVLVVSGVLGEFYGFFKVVFGLSMLVIVSLGFSLLGSTQSFNKLISREKKYYQDLKELIINSERYVDFRVKSYQL